MPLWVLREESEYDARVLQSVYTENEYGLPADMVGWRVLDVGACFGAFARLAAERGAIVTAYEPNPQSFSLLTRNTARTPGVVCYRQAVGVRQEKGVLVLRDDPAGCNLFGGDGGIEVDVVAFADAVREAGDGGVVDLVKIDAEGAEYGIIDETPAEVWAKVRQLAVEFHANYVPEWERHSEECRKKMAGLGFREVGWDVTHKERGWYRLGRWERE